MELGGFSPTNLLLHYWSGQIYNDDELVYDYKRLFKDWFWVSSSTLGGLNPYPLLTI